MGGRLCEPDQNVENSAFGPTCRDKSSFARTKASAHMGWPLYFVRAQSPRHVTPLLFHSAVSLVVWCNCALLLGNDQLLLPDPHHLFISQYHDCTMVHRECYLFIFQSSHPPLLITQLTCVYCHVFVDLSTYSWCILSYFLIYPSTYR